MKTPHRPMVYETPLDHEILEAYLNKTASYKRSDVRRIKRALHKLAAH